MAGEGIDYSCLLDNDKDVMCAGRNQFGKLGDGGSTSSSTYVAVSGLPAVSTLSVGSHHACVLLVDYATMQCWGGGF